MKNKIVISILFLSIAAITIAEMYNLTAISLWHDESFSALLVKYDFKEMMDRIKLDVHPPLYYIVLKGWNFLFDNSLFSLRMFSVFFSILTIITIYFFINRAFKNSGLAAFSSLLYTLSYFQVQYAMEARMYAFGTFLVVISCYFFLRALEEKKWKWWLLYAVAVSAGIYTHYFIGFWVAAQALYLVYLLYKKYKLKILLWFKDKIFQFGIGSFILVAISYVPWLGTLLKQFNQVQEDYWIPNIGIWSIPNTIMKMTSGGVIDPNRYWPVLVVFLVIVATVLLFFLIRNKNKEKWLICFLFIVPFLVTILLSFKRSIYIDRYFIFGFPFYLIMVAGAILAINNKILRGGLVAAVLIGVLITFPLHWKSIEIEKKPGMAGAAVYLNQEYQTGEKIFVGSSLIYFTFRYYNQTGFPAKLYAPSSMPHYSGTALLSEEDIIKDFNKETSKGDVVWMINTTGFGNYRPTLPENWIQKSNMGFEDAYSHLGWIEVTKYLVE